MAVHEHAGLAGHAVHAVPLLLVAAALSSRIPGWLQGARGRATRRCCLLLAGTQVAGAAVHAVAARDHVRAGPAVVTFFVLVTVAQLAAAATVLLRPDERVLTGGLFLSVGLLLLWWWSRTVGVPFGFEGGMVEPVGWTDLLADGLELSAIALTALLLRRRALPAVGVRAEQLAWGLIIVAGTGMLASA